LIERALHKMSVVGEARMEFWSDDTISFGRHVRATFNPEPQPVTDRTGRYKAFFIGYLANSKELWHGIDPLTLGDYLESDAALALAQFLQFGSGGLAKLNGVFSAAVYDTEQKRLTIFTDRYGYRLIYYAWNGKEFNFSSSFDVVADYSNGKREIVLDAACYFFTYNYYPGTRTLLENVQVLPHAAICTVSQDGIQCEQYWQYPHNVKRLDGGIDQILPEAKNLVIRAAERLGAKFPHVAVPLSGGLDSRTCAILFRGAAEEAIALHVGTRGWQETELSRKIAEAVGIPWILFDQRQYEFRQISDSAERLGDSIVLWGGCLWLPMFHHLNKHEPELSVVDGLGMDIQLGGYFVGAFPSPDFDYERLGERAFAHGMARANMLRGDFAAELFFPVPFAKRVKERAVESVAELLAEFPSGTPDERTRYFYFVHRGRRMAHLGHSLYESLCNFLFPGLDYEVFDFFSSIPYSHLADPLENFYRRLIALLSPEVARIPWADTGLPLDRDLSAKSKRIRGLNRMMSYYLGRLTHGRIDLTLPAHTCDYLFRHNKRFHDYVVETLEEFSTYDSPFASRRGIRELIRHQESGRNYFLIIEYMLTMNKFFKKFMV
jgi:asparagine synthetase B (glutamine-hydrolysing)